jgi:hypothetical protein
MMTRKTGSLGVLMVLSALLVVALMAGSAGAAVLTFDEDGHGFMDAQPLPFFMQPDPGPGGLPNVLTYILPFQGFQGDVPMVDIFEPGQPVMDIIRFNGNGTLCFYSDSSEGFDSLADTISAPLASYPNIVIIPEDGSESFNFATYVPVLGQPGYDPSLPQYTFYSDVPLPPSAFMLGAGLLGLLGFRRQRNGS